MFLSSKNTQTTAYHRFHAERQTNPNFQMNAGCCGNRNPLKGWRKEQTCCLNCCTRTQKVGGRWLNPDDAAAQVGSVFTQNQNGTSVTGTLIEAVVGFPAHGIFQMADCHSVFVPTTTLSTYIVGALGDLRADTPEPPIDTNAPCQSGGKGTPNSLGYQMVFKNVQSCCKPPRLKMIQNRAASSPEQTARNNGKPYSVSGKIDRNYNYNYRQYLKKRCMIADYDNRSGGRQRSAVKYPPSSQHVLEANCCTTTCCKCIHYATYQISWNTNNSTASDTLYDAYGNSGVIQGPSGEITTFKMDCVLFARSNGNPFLWNDVADIGDQPAAAKFIALLSVRHGACHDPKHHIPSDILTYKRSNWGFRKQGAVDNSLYIATKKVFANPCCCVCYQQLQVKTNAELNNNDIGRYLAYGESRGIIVSFSPITPPPSDDGPYYSIWVSLSDCNKPFYDTQQGGLSTNLPVAVKPKSVSNPWTRPATSCGNHSREEPGVPNPPLQAVDPVVIIGPGKPRPIGPIGGGETGGIVIIPQ